jgi:subtilisin family serine protease
VKRFLVMFMAGEREELARSLKRRGIQVRERYKAFFLVEATDEAAQALRERYIVQDIASLTQLGANGVEIDTSRPRVDKRGRTRTHPQYPRGEASRLPAGPHHWLVRFSGPVKKKWLTEIRRVGGRPCQPHDVVSHVVLADRQTIRKIAALESVEWVGHLRYADRTTGPVGDAGNYEVEFFTDSLAAQAAKEIRGLGFEVGKLQARILVVRSLRPGTRKFDRLAKVHGVREIRQCGRPEFTNDIALLLMETTVAMSPRQGVGGQGLGLSGEGQTVAVCDSGLDTGDVSNLHPDLAARVDAILRYPPAFDGKDDRSGHGTHMAGSVLGDGNRSGGRIRGPAYRARLLFQATEGEPDPTQPAMALVASGLPTGAGFGQLLCDAYSRDARVHVDALSFRRDGPRGEYNSTCYALDEFTWSHKDFCVVVAAGNLTDPAHVRGDADRVTPPGTSKNCITVGASESRRPELRLDYSENPVFTAETEVNRRRRKLLLAQDPEQISPLSRRGPTEDRRFGLDVVAPGTCILSTRSRVLRDDRPYDGWPQFADDPVHYMYLGGTSQATALTGGAVTLLREYFVKECQVTDPTAALLKAALIAGATLLPSRQPHRELVDPRQGYGRVNLDAVLAPANGASMRFKEVEPGLRERSDPYELEIEVQPGGAPLRVVLAYTDYPGDQLRNCLNLIVAPPEGKRRAGNDHTGSGNPDTRNNVEVVHVEPPVLPGRWRVQVAPYTIPHPPQPFAVVYLGNF